MLRRHQRPGLELRAIRRGAPDSASRAGARDRGRVRAVRLKDAPPSASTFPVAVRADGELARLALEDDLAALLAGLGAQLDDPVGAGDDVGVVLDDDERVAARDQPLEHAEQAPHVREVQPGRRLVEDVDRGLVRRARGELGGELEPLRLAARERVRALPDLHVADAQVGQRRERAARSSG